MKKFILPLCVFAALPLFAAHQNTERLTAEQLSSRMETMRDYDWGQGAGKLEAYIYPLYFTATSDPKSAAALEKKAVEELASNPANLRYKLLLAQTLEICGIQTSAMQLADLIIKDSAKADNLPWIERAIASYGRSSDPKAKDALLKLAANKSDGVACAAITALGVRREALQEIAKIASFSVKNDKRFMAASIALSRIGGAKALKALEGLYSKAKSPKQKQIVADSAFALLSAPKAPKADAFANKVLADANSPAGAKLEAYATLVRSGVAPAPKDGEQATIAIEVVKKNPKLAIPAYLDLAKLDEAHQVLMVNALSARGEGYDKILALTPKTPELAEAILIAAAKMGADKDFKKLVSFAPLFKDNQYREMASYISAVKGDKKVLKLSELSKSASAPEQAFISAALDKLDASSCVDVLIKDVKDGDTNAKIAALKALNTAISKCDAVFVSICGLYPNLTDPQVVSTAQRLLVNISRMKCDNKMFAAAKAQFDAAKDAKTKSFFLRFAAPNGGKAAAEFLGSAYSAGFKDEALREFAKWTNENAFATLQRLDKSDPSNSAAIRDVYIKLLRAAKASDAYVQYIVKTHKNEREMVLINMLEMPDFTKCSAKKLPGGMTGWATHGEAELRKAFDGDIKTRWATGCSRIPGMGLMFEFPNAETISGFEFELANSRNDRVLGPVVFVGDSLDNMKKVEFEHIKAEHSDIIKFKKPQNIKVFCIESTKEQGGNWCAYEIKVIK